MTDPVMLLSQVHGEGRLTFHALRAAGFTSLGAVAETPLHVLADRAHLSLQTARKLKKGAEGMIENPVTTSEPPVAPARRSSNGRVRPAAFSPGLTLEEAEMLGQGREVPAVPEAGDAPPPVAQEEAVTPAESVEPLPSAGTASSAAAAEAASGLRRPQEPSKKTFWAFG